MENTFHTINILLKDTVDLYLQQKKNIPHNQRLHNQRLHNQRPLQKKGMYLQKSMNNLQNSGRGIKVYKSVIKNTKSFKNLNNSKQINK